jgi:hypothetical protein
MLGVPQDWLLLASGFIAIPLISFSLRRLVAAGVVPADA